MSRLRKIAASQGRTSNLIMLSWSQIHSVLRQACFRSQQGCREAHHLQAIAQVWLLQLRRRSWLIHRFGNVLMSLMLTQRSLEQKNPLQTYLRVVNETLKLQNVIFVTFAFDQWLQRCSKLSRSHIQGWGF
jgi:hypothetical protein